VLLLRISPADYKGRWRAFTEAAEFLELSAPDRNIAWREHTGDEHFHEWPVPIEWWVQDPFYAGTNIVVRPRIGEFMADFNDPDALHELFVFIGGIGAGKSFFAEAATAERCKLWTPERWSS
jgi:hypothetical protein